MRPHRELAAIATLFGSSVLSGPLHAAGVTFSVSYSAPPECPNRAQFENAVAARVVSATVAERADALLALEVTLAKRADGVAGALLIESPDGLRARRDAFGADCSEVFESLAVIAAIALDGYRAARDPAASLPANATEAPASSAAEPSAPPSTASAPPQPPAPAVSRDAPARPEPGEPRRGAGMRLRPGSFAGAAWESAVAPSAPFGLAAGFELAGEPRGVFWPAARLGVLVTGTSTIERGAASADFRLVTGRLAAYPLGFGNPRGGSLHACVELDAGALRAEGEGVANAEPQWLSWLAAGLAARGELALAPWLSLEATAGARLLARRYHLVFTAADSSDNVVVYDMPPVSAGVTAGVVARLP